MSSHKGKLIINDDFTHSQYYFLNNLLNNLTNPKFWKHLEDRGKESASQMLFFFFCLLNQKSIKLFILIQKLGKVS